MAGRDDKGSVARIAELYTKPDKNDRPDAKPKPDVPRKPPKRSIKKSSEGTSDVADSCLNDLNKSENEEQITSLQEPSPESKESRKAAEQPDSSPDLRLSPRIRKTTDTKKTNREAPHSPQPVRNLAPCLPHPQNLSLPKSEEGYIHVKMGGDATEYSDTSPSSSDDDDDDDDNEEQEVNASVAEGVKHIQITININFIPKAKQKRLRKVKAKKYSYTRSGEITRNRTLHQLKPMKANVHVGAVAAEKQEECDIEPPPVPPKLPAKTYKKSGSLKTTGNDNDYLIATDQDISKDGDDWGYESYAINEQPSRKSKYNRDYDEITLDLEHEDENNQPTENPEASVAIDEFSDYSQVNLQTVNTEVSPSWLFDYKSRTQAEDQLKTDQNGSFVVIEEDHRSMPFTPYTFLIVHGGQLKKIPVLKLSPRRGKVKYTLANSELKQKSIEDIVWFYQRHNMPGLDIRLKSPD